MKVSHGDRQSLQEYSLNTKALSQSNANNEDKPTLKSQSLVASKHRDGDVDTLKQRPGTTMDKGQMVAGMLEQLSNMSGMKMPERSGVDLPGIGQPPDSADPGSADRGSKGNGSNGNNVLDDTPGGNPFKSNGDFKNPLTQMQDDFAQRGAAFDAALNDALRGAGIPTGFADAFGMGAGTGAAGAADAAMDQMIGRNTGGYGVPAGKPNPADFNSGAELKSTFAGAGEGGRMPFQITPEQGAGAAVKGTAAVGAFYGASSVVAGGATGGAAAGALATAAAAGATAVVAAAAVGAAIGTAIDKGATAALSAATGKKNYTIGEAIYDATHSDDKPATTPTTTGTTNTSTTSTSTASDSTSTSTASADKPSTTGRPSDIDRGGGELTPEAQRRIAAQRGSLINKLDPDDGPDMADMAGKLANAAAMKIASVINIGPDGTGEPQGGDGSGAGLPLPDNDLVNPVEPPLPGGTRVDIPDVHPGMIGGGQPGGGRGPRGGLTM